MALDGFAQPELLAVDETLRLRRYCDDCAFALAWYQDRETLLLVDGADRPYDMARLLRMYRYLAARGEVYFIEVRDGAAGWRPIGDVTLCREDLPIVIGERALRGRGIGRRVLGALIARGKALGLSHLAVQEIYHYNIGSQKLFESLGFQAVEDTGKGRRYRLEL